MDDVHLTVLLDPFLTRSFHDEAGLVTFVSYAWRHVLGFREIILWELCIKFLSSVRFNRESRIWSDGSALSFRLGGDACSCNLMELGQRLGIYSDVDIDHPFLDSYLDSYILSEAREYNHLDVWSLSIGEYVSWSAKESSFRSPLHRFIHHLIASTFHHCEEYDKVPICGHFPMWCLMGFKHYNNPMVHIQP